MRKPGGGKGVDALPGRGCGGGSLGEEAGEEAFGGLHFRMRKKLCGDVRGRWWELKVSSCKRRCFP